jgi:hypothetical protein
MHAYIDIALFTAGVGWISLPPTYREKSRNVDYGLWVICSVQPPGPWCIKQGVTTEKGGGTKQAIKARPVTCSNTSNIGKPAQASQGRAASNYYNHDEEISAAPLLVCISILKAEQHSSS